MSKLLKADFSRLVKNKLFWVFTLATLGYSIYKAIGTYNCLLKNEKEGFSSTVFPFEYIIIFAFIIAIFTCFFIGVNETDGIIRNKLFCGHTRTEIYFSNIIVSAFVSLLYSLVFISNFISLIIIEKADIKIFLAYIIVSLVVTFVFSTISTFIAFIIRGKAVSTVIAIATIGLMFLASSSLGSILGEPKTSYQIDTVNGVSYNQTDLIPEGAELTYIDVENPNYCGGRKRYIYNFINELLPTTQFIIISDVYISSDGGQLTAINHHSYDNNDDIAIESPNDVFKSVNILYSLSFSIVITAFGVFLYKRKELN